MSWRPSVEDILPRPLTRKNADGEIYVRLSSVERAIARWESVEARLVAGAAASLDYRSSNYVKLEVLLSLLRSAGKEGRGSDFYALFTVFMARVRALIRQRSSRYHSDLDVLLDETCSALALRLAEDAANPSEDELDFFEVRFAPALHYFVLHRLGEDNRWYSLHQSVDSSTDDDDRAIDRLQPDRNDLTDPERAALAAEINDVLHLLTDEEHLIVDLYFLKGMKINSKDGTEPTIVKTLQLSERTVHYRIKSAGKKLSKFKERK